MTGHGDESPHRLQSEFCWLEVLIVHVGLKPLAMMCRRSESSSLGIPISWCSQFRVEHHLSEVFSLCGPYKVDFLCLSAPVVGGSDYWCFCGLGCCDHTLRELPFASWHYCHSSYGSYSVKSKKSSILYATIHEFCRSGENNMLSLIST